MPDFPTVIGEPPLSMLSVLDPRVSALADFLFAMRASLASGTYPSANRAYYYPITLNDWVTVTQMSLYNGATVAGNVDVGIYDINGNRLVSAGGVAMAGASTVQVFDIADTALVPGDYYLAMACSSASATFFRYQANAQVMEAFESYMQASAYPLPATATFVAATVGFVPMLTALCAGSII